MILGKTAHAVALGRVTLIREPLTTIAEPYTVGHSYAVQTRPAKEAVCRVEVTELTRSTVGALTFDEARAAGFRTRDDAHAAWLQQHRLGELDPAQPVWIIRLKLDRTERPRFLVRSGYSQSPGGSIDYELEETIDPDGGARLTRRAIAAVDDTTVAWITDEARRRMPVGNPRKAPPAEPGLVHRVEQALREELRTRFRGESPEDVAAAAPRQGTPGEIRRRRRAMGLRGVDGLFPVPGDQVAELVESMADEGCSVREVAHALDCSVGKAHQLLRPYRESDAA